MPGTGKVIMESHAGTAASGPLPWRIAKSLAGAAMAAAAISSAIAAAPIPGETYVYQLTNGYNNEPRAQVTYRVENVEADRIAVAVSADTPAVEAARTEIYASDGNPLRAALTSHNRLRVFDFAPAYPAYAFPLEPGKSWSVRVKATDPVTGRRNSVRVDGKVLGHERIRVPAGEFDTIKIRRKVYAGDFDGFLLETNITEFDWYAPALGRSVRSETRSGYMNTGQCGRFGCEVVRGDWNIYELVSRTRQSGEAPQPHPRASQVLEARDDHYVSRSAVTGSR
jgi:hypothetical protein